MTWFHFLAVTEIFFFATTSRPGLGATQPPFPQQVDALSRGEMAREIAEHYSPYSSEVTNEWSFNSVTSIPPYIFMVWSLGTGSVSLL
jgi:hypothetical protein